MSAAQALQLSEFAQNVREGLGREGQKSLSPRYFYDELGSILFEAITLLPEYGLTRADERLLRSHARDIAGSAGSVVSVAELGSGSGRKTRYLLQAFERGVEYFPIDISSSALDYCEKQLNDVATVSPICADWMDGLQDISASRISPEPLLLLFLGSSVGNLLREDLPAFFAEIRRTLRPGDFFLLGADLVKDTDTMINAYDDAVGVTAAFNLNLLARINRELDANFELRSFNHEARWNEEQRRIEMHLLSCREQSVFIQALNEHFTFAAGETIWTESSNKFRVAELEQYAVDAGFEPVETWVDEQWPFAEALWQCAD